MPAHITLRKYSRKQNNFNLLCRKKLRRMPYLLKASILCLQTESRNSCLAASSVAIRKFTAGVSFRIPLLSETQVRQLYTCHTIPLILRYVILSVVDADPNFYVDADLDRDLDWHQNDANPHAILSQGKHTLENKIIFYTKLLIFNVLFF